LKWRKGGVFCPQGEPPVYKAEPEKNGGGKKKLSHNKKNRRRKLERRGRKKVVIGILNWGETKVQQEKKNLHATKEKPPANGPKPHGLT